VQTFSDLPGNRRVQMSWMQGGKYPDMPFNQQMSCPYEFTLRKHGFGSYKLFALPVKEIESLRGAARSWKNLELKPGDNPLAGITGDLWDISAEIEPGTAKQVGFKVRGRTVAYNVKPRAMENTLSSEHLNAQLPMKAGRIKIRILVDRTSLEVFGNDGEAVIPACFLPDESAPSLELFAAGGTAKLALLEIYPMRSAWRVS